MNTWAICGRLTSQDCVEGWHILSGEYSLCPFLSSSKSTWAETLASCFRNIIRLPKSLNGRKYENKVESFSVKFSLILQCSSSSLGWQARIFCFKDPVLFSLTPQNHSDISEVSHFRCSVLIEESAGYSFLWGPSTIRTHWLGNGDNI